MSLTPPCHLQYFYFSGDPLYVNVLDDLVLFQNFDGDFFSCQVVRSELDFAKGAFSYGFANQVMPNTSGFVLTVLLSAFVLAFGMVPILAGRLSSCLLFSNFIFVLVNFGRVA